MQGGQLLARDEIQTRSGERDYGMVVVVVVQGELW